MDEMMEGPAPTGETLVGPFGILGAVFLGGLALVPLVAFPHRSCGVPRTVRVAWTERQAAVEQAMQEEGAVHEQREAQR